MNLSAEFAIWAFVWYLFWNMAGFVCFALDKALAVYQKRRISEKTLLRTALFGGFIGGWLAGRIFRHKTIKASFRRAFLVATLLHVLGVIGLVLVFNPNNSQSYLGAEFLR